MINRLDFLWTTLLAPLVGFFGWKRELPGPRAIDTEIWDPEGRSYQMTMDEDGNVTVQWLGPDEDCESIKVQYDPSVAPATPTHARI